MPFSYSKKITRQSVEDKITLALKFLDEIPEERKKLFIDLVEVRKNDFIAALEGNKIDDEEKEREKVLIQYHRFASTLYNCLQHPRVAHARMPFYFNLKNYHPVGTVVHDGANTTLFYSTFSGSSLGVSLIVGSIAAFAFNLLIGCVLLPLGMTLLATSIAIYYANNSHTNIDEVQHREKAIFQKGAQLLVPELTFQEQTEVNTGSYITCSF